MPNHRELLEHLSARDLRAVATRLRVEPKGARNPDRVSAIASYWAQTAASQACVSRLSESARGALRLLVSVRSLPAVLFFGEYGAIRPAQKRYARGHAPWRLPLTAAEELYYCGLLFAEPGKRPARTDTLAIPDDLRWLADLLEPSAPRATATDGADAVCAQTAESIVHDLAQLLILLHSQCTLQPEESLLHSRWLRPSALALLHQRLMQPDPGRAPRGNRQSDRMRLLMFLATAMGLHEGGVLSPVGWAWLDAPFGSRYSAVWTGYLSATAEQRSIYLLPDAGLPSPWPNLLSQSLAALPPTFSSEAFVAALLCTHPDAALYWPLHLSTLSALRDLAESVVREVLVPLGAATAVVDDAGQCRSVHLNPQGRALTTGQPFSPHHPVESPAEMHRDGADFVVKAAGIEGALARLAPYAVWEGLDALGGTARHSFRMRRESLQRAAAAGCPLPTLMDALLRVGVEPAPHEQRMLAEWHGAVGEVGVGLWPLLRTKDRAQMQAILDEKGTSRFAAEMLAPTVAVLHDGMAHAASILRTFGWHVAGGAYADHDKDRSASADVQLSARTQAATRRIVGAVPAQDFPADEQPALWLAGQLYRTLAKHLALPLPPPSKTLEKMHARFAPAVQAALAAAWALMERDMLAFLDGESPLTLPVTESDGEQWRPLIEDAVTRGLSLQMTYISPARGLPVQRVIQPYAFETRRAVTYLRAYCLQADRVLTFRLDRILGLAYTTE